MVVVVGVNERVAEGFDGQVAGLGDKWVDKRVRDVWWKKDGLR